MMYNTFGKLNGNLEAVGQTLGISRMRIILNVLVPQSKSTIAEMFSYFFVNSMMTISAVSFLLSLIHIFVAVSEPLFAVAIIMEGVCNGIGDTRASFMISAGTMWGVRIAGTLICVYVFHGGLQAVWCCMVADNTCRCCLLLLRFLRGRWKRQLAVG